MGREGAKVYEHGGINVDGSIEECADYLLHKVDGLWGKLGGGVGVVGVLDFGAVGGGIPGMRGILWERRLGVLELVQRFLKVIGHGNVASPSRLIPLDVDTTEQGAGPTHRDGVLSL